MGITVREVLALKEFHAFQLVAGESGLDNRIETIGILDYEFSMQNDEQPKKWGFRKYDFVLTSLLFAKGREELLLPAIKELCHDQVSALAVKNVCYTELPQEVLQYADEHDLPIFMFGRDDAYFEDIIVTLKSKIAERNDLEWLEHKIALLLNGELDLKGQREVNRELLTERTRPYRILYCYVQDREEAIRDYHKCYQVKENAFYYKGGCFIVKYDPVPSDWDKNFYKYRGLFDEVLRMPPENYWIGFSEIHENPEELVSALKEGLCAQMYCRLFDCPRSYFGNMGLYQVLLPGYQEEWFDKFSKNLIQKILGFDREYDGNLFETTKYYVKYHGNIMEVAEQLHLHKNTVRYRINKVRELLNMEEDGSFEQQIAIAFMVDELKQLF